MLNTYCPIIVLLSLGRGYCSPCTEKKAEAWEELGQQTNVANQHLLLSWFQCQTGWEEVGQEDSIAFALSGSLFFSISDGDRPWSYAVLGLYPSLGRVACRLEHQLLQPWVSSSLRVLLFPSCWAH